MAPIDLSAVTLAELRYVVALADHRHFGRAAAACGVTQPTLSAQVQKLERTLSVAIFERSSKSVRPTPLGEDVIATARAMLDGLQRLGEVAHSAREPLAGPLRLGMIPTLGPYLLPRIVQPLRAAFPKLQLVFRELKTATLVEDLTAHELDAGILALPLPPHAHGIATSAVFDEPFFVVLPPQHALAKKKTLREQDLEGERVLLLDEGHCLRDQALSICRRAQADTGTEHSDFRATSIETLRHMVAAGMGVTLLPSLALASDEEARSHVLVRPFAAPVPVRHMALAWRKSHPRAADMRKLAEFVRAHAPAGTSAKS